MAVTKTTLCNQALGRIGSPHVMDIDDADSKSARICNESFEVVVREVGRASDWNSLKERVELGRLTAVPAFGWAYQYQLPANFISLVELNGLCVTGQLGDNWEIEGQVLLTDAAEAKIRFIGYNERVHEWDPLLINAVVVLLAAKIALPVRQDAELAASLMNEYERVALPAARMKNGNERKRKRFNPAEDCRVIQSRYYSTNG